MAGRDGGFAQHSRALDQPQPYMSAAEHQKAGAGAAPPHRQDSHGMNGSRYRAASTSAAVSRAPMLSHFCAGRWHSSGRSVLYLIAPLNRNVSCR
jgi:hypothetical protein